jgi:hypothetical protein
VLRNVTCGSGYRWTIDSGTPRVLGSRLIHPATELGRASQEIGFGVFATEHIPRGTIVWVLDRLDRLLSPAQVESLGNRYEKVLNHFSYLNARGGRVLCWDLARWVNHSCDANCLSTGWEFDIAVRDIEAGEEITNDYACLNLEESFTCHCKTLDCRGTVHPGDFDDLADVWDQRVREAFPDVARVEQPMWEWLPRQREVRAAMFDPTRLPSIRRHQFSAPPPISARRSAASR